MVSAEAVARVILRIYRHRFTDPNAQYVPVYAAKRILAGSPFSAVSDQVMDILMAEGYLV